MSTIAIDNETFLITRELPFPPVVCLSWYDGKNSAVLPHTSVYEWIAAKLADLEVYFVGHFVAYDFGTLAASWPDLLPAIFAAYKAGRITDTMIRQQLFDIAVGRVLADDKLKAYSLASLYKLCKDKDMPGGSKTSILAEPSHVRYNFGSLYNVDFVQWPDEYIEYARNDPICTYEVWDEQNKAAHLLRDDAFQSYASFCLLLTSAQGLRTDAGCVRTFKADQLELMQSIEPELVAAGMLEAKYKGRGEAKHQVGWVKKEKAAQERIAAACEAKGIKPLPTKGGQIAVNRTACHWAGDALMLRRAEYVTAEKMISTYIPFLEAGADGPVTSQFNLAATGRTTSSTPRPPAVGGNMQNAPRKTKRLLNGEIVDSDLGVRECFTPRLRKVYLSGDFKSAELHGVAQVCLWKLGYSSLGEVLKSGRDAHIFLACYLIGATEADYDDVMLRYGQGDPIVIEARQEAKIGNFGFWGGMGVNTFRMNQLREGKYWEKEKATRLRGAWLTAYPETHDYFEANKQELGPKAQAVVEFYWSKRLRRVKGFSTICNGWFQALVADGVKKAVTETIRRCYIGGPDSPLYTNNTRPGNMVHDDLTTETDDGTPEQLHPVVTEFRETLQNEFNVLVPDYPTAVDVVLSYCISKRAKPVYTDEGYLKPWIA